MSAVTPDRIAPPHTVPLPTVAQLDAHVVRNIDIVSPAEQAALRASRVLVAGCGSVGGSLVESLVRLGATAAVLADPEVFDETNLNRQACTLADVGRPKTEVLAERARAINPYFDARMFTEGLTTDNLESAFQGVTCVFDAIDAGASPWVKYRVHEIACERRIPVVAGFDFGGKATLYVFDYRRHKARPFYGRATAEMHRSGQLAQCVKWLGYRHFPADFLGIIRDRMLTGNPWPQVSYCVLAMGALATRCVLDLEMRRNVRHVVAFDVHDAMRTLPARIGQWIDFPVQLARAFVASRQPRGQRTASASGAAKPVDDDLQRVVDAMVLAPSPHNCQPWVFERIGPDSLRLRWNHARATPVVDPDADAVAYSLGCAVEAASKVADIDWEPHDGVDFHDRSYDAGTLRIHRLDPARYARGRGLLERRVTHRGPMLHVPATAEFTARCRHLAARHGAHAVLREVDPARMTTLAHEGAAALFARLDYVEELLDHMRLAPDEIAATPTGFTPATLHLSGWETRVLGLLRRSKAMRALAMRTGLPALMTRNTLRPLAGHATYLLVAAGEWTTRGKVNAGRALMRVWLELTGEGLHAQPVDFPISTPPGREAVAAMFGLDRSARPIALLRVGMVGRALPPRAPRLPASALMVAGASTADARLADTTGGTP